MTNTKIAFYLMNEKGFYTLKKFIKNFGAQNIVYIVSSQDNNMKKDYFHEIMVLCKKKNILFFNRNDDYKEYEKKFQGYRFTIGWKWMIKNEKKLIVFHDSLLPMYRGFSPLVNSLINGEKVIGVTALFANSEYDKGDIIMQKSITISYPITIKKSIKKIRPLYYQLVEQIYNLIINNQDLPSYIQDEDKATYSIWLNEKDYYINWEEWSAKKIKRFVDAVGYPFDNAKSILNSQIIEVIEVKIIKDIKIKNRKRHLGKIVFIKENYPVIICKKGLIALVKIHNGNDNKFKINFRSKFQ